ncbi:MAG TPA: hypothetical protein VLY24_09720 [Bryobacteraceae bacterium]|nr:hypothetical protein [Bryobacteraceae bacterium]
MCDYSLAGMSNRLAEVGEDLVVRRFSTGCLGMSEPRRRWYEALFPSFALAVCIPPGARLLLHGIPAHLQTQLNVSAAEEVTFVQRTADAFTYRDGVRFSNGREILLQQLACGQQARVLRLHLEEEPAPGGFDWPEASEYHAKKALLGGPSGYPGGNRSVRRGPYVTPASRQ